ncbi:MAG TPA: thiamine phosphate synthase [Candidatus Angelobacter sp.]|nr:thiamine phosphate synthase [Candidatus Angelobacter sp.]
MSPLFPLPPVYPILDAGRFSQSAAPLASVVNFALELVGGGASLIQYRNKSGDARTMLSHARELRRAIGSRAVLMMNDRVDLCVAAGFDGVHLGQDDLSPIAARRILQAVAQSDGNDGSGDAGQVKVSEEQAAEGKQEEDGKQEGEGKRSASRSPLWVGFSTHNVEQVREADRMPVDYIAIGPVFATGSKANPDPVVGLEGVREARRATAKPLVAIGGITRLNCRQVLESGANSVAVIADLVQSPRKTVEEFLSILR